MIAIKAHFDGEKVVLPDDVRGVPPGDVILVFETEVEPALDTSAWMKAQEEAFSRVWDNDQDAVYDSL